MSDVSHDPDAKSERVERLDDDRRALYEHLSSRAHGPRPRVEAGDGSPRSADESVGPGAPDPARPPPQAGPAGPPPAGFGWPPAQGRPASGYAHPGGAWPPSGIHGGFGGEPFPGAGGLGGFGWPGFGLGGPPPPAAGGWPWWPGQPFGGGWSAPNAAGDPNTSPLIPMKAGSDRRPALFLVHGMLGSVFPFHKLGLHLPADRRLFGLQARGLDGQQEPLTNLAEMAAAYAGVIQAVAPGSLVHVGGYSFGGLVAYEIARVLQQAGQTVGSVAILGAPAPMLGVPEPLRETWSVAVQSLNDWFRLMSNAWAAEGHFRPMMSQSPIAPMQRVALANQVAASGYSPEPQQRGIDLILTLDQRPLTQLEWSLGWQRLCSGLVRVQMTGGGHLGLFEEPQVKQVADWLEEAMVREEQANDA